MTQKKLSKFVPSFIGLAMLLVALPSAYAQEEIVQPIVYQAAGPDAASIQGTVDAYRLAVGDPLNGNAPGPLANGRREINWDGGGSDATTDPVTPFNVFLNTRGAQFTTPGIGLSQAPAAGGAQGGLAVLFNNPTYANIFSTFSPVRLFTPVGSKITDAFFFVPGTNGATPAAVTGFGVIFTDVDQPNGDTSGKPRVRIDYFDAAGNRLYTTFAPASPGDGGLSFIGIVFSDARIAHVRIKTDSRPGPDDGKKDIVMMDDFIYGEPQQLQ
ncbi:MAG TPA: hypothetical protein VLH08_08095 [Acidobacteriota bacterium]|nr:hypothetical protein [Acidobacteriota bacterium]